VNALRYRIPDGNWSQPPDLAGAQATPPLEITPPSLANTLTLGSPCNREPDPRRRQQKVPVNSGRAKAVPSLCPAATTRILRFSD